jgi:uncharacterized protein (TIGR03118 family)
MANIKRPSLALAAVAIPVAFALPTALYERINLLSDGALATPKVDKNLVNSWGLASSPTGPLWIANAGSGTAAVVRADGTAAIPDVAVPADRSGRPTGVVFNGSPGFQVRQGESRAPAVFLFVTLEGRILGWNPQVDAANAIVAVSNGSDAGAVYTGAALAERRGETALFVANFGTGTVDVFDQAFRPAGSFTDAGAPPGYAPFGIATIDDQLYVTFVPHDKQTGGPLPGRGNGLIDVFSSDGTLLRRLATGGELDLPWAMVSAPEDFGPFSRKLLVGNFGDGRILGFHQNGHFFRRLEDSQGEEIVIDGLWGLRFGNGGSGGDRHELFFAAGIERETHGLFGVIRFGH